MIRQLMKTCELNAFEASFTETAYWLAYFICPIPIAMFMKNTATNRELFSGYYWRHVVGYCSSPLPCWKNIGHIYAYSLSLPPECVFRNGSQSLCNRFGRSEKCAPSIESGTIIQWAGSFIAAMFLSKLILSGNHYTRDTLPTSFPGGWKVTFKQKQTPWNFLICC